METLLFAYCRDVRKNAGLDRAAEGERGGLELDMKRLRTAVSRG